MEASDKFEGTASHGKKSFLRQRNPPRGKATPIEDGPPPEYMQKMFSTPLLEREADTELPALVRHEPPELAITVDDEPDSDGLDPACAQPARYLLPEER